MSVYDANGKLLRQENIIDYTKSNILGYSASLEYDSVKIIIPSSNSKKITHGIFYTAITRAKKKLKIYWSAETMQQIINSFNIDNSTHRSLDIIKQKLSML